MPYPSLETLSRTLRQPVWLATAVSVGVHGVLFAVLPILPLSSKTAELDTRRTVQLVELTPEEQSRVPQLSLPQTLPPINSSSANLLPPPPLSSNQLLTPPPLIDPSSLYQLPITPPPPITSWNWNLPTSQPPLRRLPKQKAVPNPKPSASPSPSPKPSGAPNPNPQPSQSPSPGATTAPASSSARPDKPSPEMIARYQADLQKLREKFAFNGAGRTQEKYSESVSSLVANAKEAAKDGSLAKEWRKQEEISSVYPSVACPAKLKSDAQVGAVVDPMGRVVGNPIILLSSGYQVLDAAALNYVLNENKFPASKDKEFQPTIVPFKFEYSEAVCPAAKSTAPPS